MNRLGWFLLGVGAILVIEGITASVFISRAHGWSAQEKPTGIEKWIARRVREAAVPQNARQRQNPVSNTEEVIADARAHWADHCALCHGNDGRGDTPIETHLYPPAPDMRAPDVQTLSDGELFFTIQNGIRLSGIPLGGADRSARSRSFGHHWGAVSSRSGLKPAAGIAGVSLKAVACSAF